MKRYVVPGLSGLLLVFSFAPFDLYPLAWVGLAPLLIVLRAMPAREAFRAGFVTGMVYFFGTAYWIYHSVHDYGGIALVPSLLLVIALASYLALYPAVFAWLFAEKLRHSRLPAMAIAPAIWVSLEFLRSYALTGFPWSTLGYSQWKFPAIIQIADITGVYGVSFLLVLANAAVADFFIVRQRIREMPLFPLSATVAGYALLILALTLSLIYGGLRLGEKPKGHPLKASVIQGNIAQDTKWDDAKQREIFELYSDMTLGAVFEAPELIVWPESALPFPFDERNPLVGRLKDAQGSFSIPLLLGAIRQKEPGGPYANSAVLVSGGGASYIYDKIHLVPFGEYVPLKRLLFFVNKLSEAIGDYEPGELYTRGSIRQGEFATLICYEIIFPGLVRKFYKDGGAFIVTITNDAWFGKSAGPYQHFSMAALRAVENRKPVIRAANSGISGFIDSKGRVIKKTALFERKTLTAELKTDETITFYSRFGDLFSYLCILASLLILIPGSRTR